jgi:hypothetical protein
MNKEKELDIRVFNTVGGRQIVGELIGVHEDCVHINCALECKTILASDATYKTTFIPAVPFDDHSGVLMLQLDSIESEAYASDKLVDIYINQLIINNLSETQLECFDQNHDNQTNLTDLAKQDYWKYFKDKMMS